MLDFQFSTLKSQAPYVVFICSQILRNVILCKNLYTSAISKLRFFYCKEFWKIEQVPKIILSIKLFNDEQLISAGKISQRWLAHKAAVFMYFCYNFINILSMKRLCIWQVSQIFSVQLLSNNQRCSSWTLLIFWGKIFQVWLVYWAIVFGPYLLDYTFSLFQKKK